MAAKLKKLEIETPADLLYHLPRAYVDYSKPVPIKSTRIGEVAVIKGKISALNVKRTARKWMSIVEFMVSDDSGSIKIIYFNQPYLKDTFKEGDELYFYGKVAYDFSGSVKSLNSPDYSHKPRIVPIYPETKSVTSKYLNRLAVASLAIASEAKEFLPQEIKSGSNLINYDQALRFLHQPSDMREVDLGKRRLAFDELYLTALQTQIYRKSQQQQKALAISVGDNELKKFVDSLPFTLTDSQRKSCWQIVLDLKKVHPMNRLLNGDVGSGKTVVAAMAAFAVIKSGYRVVVMAPTEVLAFQHFETLQKILCNHDIKVGLATSSRKELSESKDKTETAIESCDILVGTHAVLEDTFNHEKVALVVVDEQHRFGVEQRAKIQKMTRQNNQYQAHFLSMTATPIPRTLQLTLYGDLDVSILDEMPKGRKQIETKVYSDRGREEAYQLIRDQVKLGRQAFVVCPLIEEQTSQNQISNIKDQKLGVSLFDQDKKTVIAEQKRLKESVFPDLRIGLMHGKLKPKEKASVMEEFASRKLDILVSTSVVEVGVDVPNASVMMIENAERFGLAQLHQFRGRVGRAEHQSYCLLMSPNPRPENIKRLKAMETHASGFKLAEIDLELRGPGVIYGKEQSGFGDLRLDWVSDIFLLEEAREAAKKTLQLYPDIAVLPQLSLKLDEKFGATHLE